MPWRCWLVVAWSRSWIVAKPERLVCEPTINTTIRTTLWTALLLLSPKPIEIRSSSLAWAKCCQVLGHGVKICLLGGAAGGTYGPIFVEWMGCISLHYYVLLLTLKGQRSRSRMRSSRTCRDRCCAVTLPQMVRCTNYWAKCSTAVPRLHYSGADYPVVPRSAVFLVIFASVIIQQAHR